MRTPFLLGTFLVSMIATACASPPTAPSPDGAVAKPAANAGQDGDKEQADGKGKEKAAARKQKNKELRNKEREVETAKVEQQIAEIERAVRQRGIELALHKAAAELTKARADLEVFLATVKPRELEEKRIGLDQSLHRLEHSKDELGELVAMYEADEFAKTTKELVLKRGRREVEMAERYLAVAQKEMQHFEQVVLPQRERELRDKFVDAEHEQRKADSEAAKARLEIAQATKKEAQRLADLQEEIAELRAELAKETP
jgi:hypothetical protein